MLAHFNLPYKDFFEMELTFTAVLWPLTMVMGPLFLSLIVARWNNIELKRGSIPLALRTVFGQTVILVHMIPVVFIAVYFPLVESMFAISALTAILAAGFGQLISIYFARFLNGNYDSLVHGPNYQWVFLLSTCIYFSSIFITITVIQMIFIVMGV